MSVQNFFIGCVIGAISGLVSAGSLYLNLIPSDTAIFFAPGAIFGIVTSFYLAWRAKKKDTFLVLTFVGWTLICTIAYTIAVFIAINLTQGKETVAIMVAGFVGAAIVSSAYPLVIRKLSYVSTLSAIVAGGVLSLFIFTPPQFYLLFIVWQAGVFGFLNASKQTK